MNFASQVLRHIWPALEIWNNVRIFLSSGLAMLAISLLMWVVPEICALFFIQIAIAKLMEVAMKQETGKKRSVRAMQVLVKKTLRILKGY